MIINDESEKSMTFSAGLLGSMSTIHVHDPTTMYLRTTGSKFIKNQNLFCEFCKLKGYTKTICYKLVGYPNDSRFKKRGGASANIYKSGSSTGGHSANNVYSETHNENQDTEAQTANSQVKNMVQTRPCSFTQN